MGSKKGEDLEEGQNGGASMASEMLQEFPQVQFSRGFSRMPDGSVEKHFTRTGAKTAYCLSVNVKAFVEKYGRDYCGFLTLTFPDKAEPPRAEIYRRFNSLRAGLLAERYKAYISAVERGAIGGRLHFHLVVATHFNVRRGVDFEQFKLLDYRSASRELRAEWAFLRETLPLYGFGRHELLPIRTDATSLGDYIGKYLVKHLSCRVAADKGLRLVRISEGERAAVTRFTWNSRFQAEFRDWCRSFSAESGFSESELGRKLGSLRPLMRGFLQDRKRKAASDAESTSLKPQMS